MDIQDALAQKQRQLEEAEALAATLRNEIDTLRAAWAILQRDTAVAPKPKAKVKPKPPAAEASLNGFRDLPGLPGQALLQETQEVMRSATAKAAQDAQESIRSMIAKPVQEMQEAFRSMASGRSLIQEIRKAVRSLEPPVSTKAVKEKLQAQDPDWFQNVHYSSVSGTMRRMAESGELVVVAKGGPGKEATYRLPTPEELEKGRSDGGADN